MSKTFKNTTLPTGGILYQNLVGLEILLDWLGDPTRFRWVALECEDANIAPRALDDIVAEYSDGRRMYLQVKCTNDPSDSNLSLTWEWLLEQAGQQRSLLRKLFDAFSGIASTPNSEIGLVTNRRPDRTFFDTLQDKHVEWHRLDPDLQKRIGADLGASGDLKQFFRALEFRHSRSDFLLLDNLLRNRYVEKYGNQLGWSHFKSESLQWLVLKPAAGRPREISLEELKRIASPQRPRPLSEDFEVPGNYQVPDATFHDNLVKALSTEKVGYVLVGPPGRGKSTYLSRLCEVLEAAGLPVIRHHFFLPSDDPEPRRLFMHDVANTLIHQIETKYGKYRPTEPPEPENLRKWVESCGIGYGSEGKRFYVVIDGLDHVWRELDHDVSQLDALFRQLFPAIPSVTLIVGTQPLTDKHMPEILRAHRKDLEWLDMPGMTPKAIQDWLSSQVASERFTPSVGQHNQSEYLAELANALFDISSGHPLHIIYSIEMLLVAGRGITTYEIENLPECPNGNIREYYEILSNRLTFLAQDILHLISAVAFLWDTTSLYQVFGENNDVSEALASVRHLTYPTPLGLKPFHGSLAAYVRERFDHEARVRALMPRAIAWLETKAPAYIKWGWLWLTQAKNGNTGDLLRGPSWEWALDGLARGYSPAQHVRITEQAERIAFRNAEYPRAVELRWLKIRLLNGPDFQTDDFARASGLILGLQKDGYLFEAMLQDLTIVSSDNLVVLGEMLAAYGRNQDAIRCKEEIRKRFNRKVTLQLGPNNRSELDRELRGLFTLFGATGDFDPKYLMTRLGRDKEGRRRLFKTLLLALIRFENVKSLMELSARPKTKAMQKTLELEIVRLACRLSVDLGKWPEFREMTFHPISFCWAKLHKVGERSLPEIELPTESIDKSYWSTNEEPDLEAWIHQHFFWCLGKTLNREILLLPKIEFPKSPWLTAVVPNLQEAARGAAQRLARRESVGFGHVWGFFRDLPKPSGYDEQNTQNVLRRTLAEIATDLALLNQSAGHNTEAAITARDLALAEDSGNFYVGFWRNRCVRRGEALLTASDAQEHVSKILKETSRKVTPFNERTNLYLDLAEFSSLFGLSTLVEQAVHHIVRCLLGYGWRKDYGIFYILDALEACAAAKLPQCEDWVARIAPGVEQIGESTDGDEVGHAREQLGTLLLTVNPSRYVAYYESLLRREEWYIAERVLEAYASTLKDAPLDKALVATLFEGSLLGSIAEQPQMLALLSTRLAELGQKKPHLRDRPTSSEVSKPFEFNAATYPPGQFGSLLDALRKDDRLSFESESINKWVDYWGPIQPNDVLQELEPYFATSDVPYALSDVPDKLFDIATSLQGKKSAYRWLVLAQIQRHGWDPIYGGRSGYHDRLEKAATIYPEKWSDFIQDTSKHTFSGAKWRDTLVIGSSRLVEFLLLARQTRIAIDLTEVMIRCFERELIEQPLPSPDWIN